MPCTASGAEGRRGWEDQGGGRTSYAKVGAVWRAWSQSARGHRTHALASFPPTGAVRHPWQKAQPVGLRDSILGMLRSPWASRLPRESWGISSCIEGEGSRTKCFRLSRALPVPASPLSWPESQLYRAPCRWTLIPRCFRNIKTSSSLSCKQLTAPLWLLHVLGPPTAQFPGLGLWQSRATLRVSASATKCLSAPPALTGRPGTASHVTVHCFWKPLKCRIWGWDLILGRALSLSKA